MKDTVCMYQRVMGCGGASHEPIAVCDPEIPKIAGGYDTQRVMCNILETFGYKERYLYRGKVQILLVVIAF